tara:strand:+ start:7592 stop:8314 length:723 start_codon:yes stop_codon:yes gene_type:complete
MKIEWKSAKDTIGSPTREFSLQGDRRVTGAVWIPANPTPNAALICFGHGASGTRYQEPICDLANRFSKAGYPCLSIDGPVHGLRQVGDGARGAFFPEFQREDSIKDMVVDWQQSIEAVNSLEEIDSAGIAYFGWSMGSIYGIPLVAARKDVKVTALGLIGVSNHFPHGETILAAAAKVHCPVTFQMQLEDELFDREGYLRVFDAFATKDKRIHANPGLHPEVPAEEIDFSFQFISKVLKG